MIEIMLEPSADRTVTPQPPPHTPPQRHGNEPPAHPPTSGDRETDALPPAAEPVDKPATHGVRVAGSGHGGKQAVMAVRTGLLAGAGQLTRTLSRLSRRRPLAPT